jgi:hypothetical protein
MNFTELVPSENSHYVVSSNVLSGFIVPTDSERIGWTTASGSLTASARVNH